MEEYWKSVKGDLARFEKLNSLFEDEIDDLQINPNQDIYKDGGMNSEFLSNEISYKTGKVKKVLNSLTKMHMVNEIFLKDFTAIEDSQQMERNLTNYQEFVRSI